LPHQKKKIKRENEIGLSRQLKNFHRDFWPGRCGPRAKPSKNWRRRALSLTRNKPGTKTREPSSCEELWARKRWRHLLQAGNRNSKRDSANLTGAHSERKASGQKKGSGALEHGTTNRSHGRQTGRDQKGFKRGSEIRTGALACGQKTK
jgi:hypothetical protein